MWKSYRYEQGQHPAKCAMPEVTSAIKKPNRDPAVFCNKTTRRLPKPICSHCCIYNITFKLSVAINVHLLFNLIFIYIFVSEPAGNITSPDDLFQYVSSPLSGHFQCALCCKRFAGRVAVRNHVESIHFPKLFVYDCVLCGKTLTSQSAMNYHLSTRHKKPS
jgi:hypothetical protein